MINAKIVLQEPVFVIKDSSLIPKAMVVLLALQVVKMTVLEKFQIAVVINVILAKLRLQSVLYVPILLEKIPQVVTVN